MTLLDVVLLLLLALSAWGGYRRGAVLQVAGLTGLVLGFAVGIWLSPHVAGLVRSDLAKAGVALGTVLVLGGVGDAAVRFFSGFKADFGIFGVGGIDQDGALLDFHSDEFQAREAIVANCRIALLVADVSKFGRNATVRGGHLGECHHFFTDKPVPQAAIDDLLTVARWSGSARNFQPWTFVVVRDRDTLRRLAMLQGYVTHLAGADLAIILVMSQYQHKRR